MRFSWKMADFLQNMLENDSLTCKQTSCSAYHFKYFQNIHILIQKSWDRDQPPLTSQL